MGLVPVVPRSKRDQDGRGATVPVLDRPFRGKGRGLSNGHLTIKRFHRWIESLAPAIWRCEYQGRHPAPPARRCWRGFLADSGRFPACRRRGIKIQ